MQDPEPEIIWEPGWFAVRIRPEWAERRRKLRLVGQPDDDSPPDVAESTERTPDP